MIYIICVINGRKTRERYALSGPNGFNCNHVMNCCHTVVACQKKITLSGIFGLAHLRFFRGPCWMGTSPSRVRVMYGPT